MDKPQQVFGTDGIRGVVGDFPITADFVLKLGWAVGMMLKEKKGNKVLIGKDTRISGYMIESALQAGLSSAGVDVNLIGPMPTPGIAYLTCAIRADIGIVISASHNPFEDNGIKFFSAEGFKISKAEEAKIEEWLNQPMRSVSAALLGKAKRFQDAQGRYVEFCKSSIPHHTNLDNLKIVLDCANGANYRIAPFVFSELGADVTLLNATPDGLNINFQCGSLYPQTLQKKVLETQADVGIAFDGDGDRVVMVDHCGVVLDGDELLYIIVKSLYDVHRFSGSVVGTLMSNLGLEIALKKLGIDLVRVPVGDQYVIQRLCAENWMLGGEPSGHIIYREVSKTADGIIGALQVLLAMKLAGLSLHEIKKGIKKLPQCLINVPYDGQPIDLDNTQMQSQIKQIETKLGKHSRVLLRCSGTEPVIRVMVEGENQLLVESAALELANTIQTLMR